MNSLKSVCRCIKFLNGSAGSSSSAKNSQIGPESDVGCRASAWAKLNIPKAW